MEIHEKLPLKTHRNIPTIVLFFFLIVLLTSIPLISADWKFNNIKNDLIIDTDTSKYGRIEIDDWYGLKNLMSLELKENTEICLDTGCSAKQEIILYEDGKLIDDVRFMDLETGSETNIKSYEIYVNGDIYNGEVLNGFSNGLKYDVELKGTLYPRQQVDWQVKSGGTDWIEDWALWSSSLKNGTIAYWKFDDGTGSKAVDSADEFDLTGNHSWGTGLLGNGAVMNNTVIIYNETVLDKNMTDFSVSFWFNPEKSYNKTLIGASTLIEKYDSTNNYFFIYLANADGRLFVGSNGNGSGGFDLSSDQTNWTANTWYHVAYIWDAGSNVSLYVNGELNDTNVYGGTLNTTTLTYDFNFGGYFKKFGFNGTIDEASIHNRTISNVEISEIYNSGAGLGFSSEVILNAPEDHYNSTDKTVLFNCTATTNLAGGNIDNVSLYHNETGTWTLNQTNSTSRLENSTAIFTVDFQNSESIEWNCYACDSGSTCSYGTNRTINLKKLVTNAESYNTFTTEGNLETFYINISTANLNIDSANFTYNNTDYGATFTQDGFNFSVSRTINVPQIVSAKNFTFNWSFEFEDSTVERTTAHNQSVTTIGIDDCSTFSNLLFNLSLKDEDNQTELQGAAEVTSIKLDFLISTHNGIDIINYSNDFNLTNPASVCLESGLTEGSLRLDGIIEYSSLNRFVEFYNLQNYSLDADTTNINISLYNLNLTKGQEFKIIYKDSNFVPIEGAILDIQRKYVEDGVYRTTERPKTGTEGYTMGHLVVNDVIYNIIVYKQGRVLASFNDIVADCQNPTLSSCTINLNSLSSSVLPESFAVTNDAIFTLTYNKTTREVDSVFSVPSGATTSFNLDVGLFDSLGNTTVCNDSLYASGGALSCIVPLSFGNSTVTAKLTKGGSLIGQSIIRIAPDPSDVYGSSIIFVALFAFMLIIGIGISDNPMIMGVVLIMGIIVLTALNIIYTPSIVGTGATILWFIVAVVIILIKGSNRQ